MLPRTQEQALRFAQRLKQNRYNEDALFEELAVHFHPNRVGFTSERTDGEDLQDHLESSAPVLARRACAASVSTMMRPSGRRWFHGRVKFAALNRDEGVRLWLEEVTGIMHDYMYDPRALMEPNLAMADDDLVTFGNACVRIGFDERKQHLKYRTRSMANVYFVSDSVGNVVGVVTFEKWTIRQIRDRFGDDKLTKGMREHLKAQNPDLDKEFELVHICLPVADAKSMGMPFKQPYSSLWMSTSCKETLEAKGYDWFPYLTPRWDLSAMEVYARSPAMVALGDAKLHQQIMATFLEAGEKALSPPTYSFGDYINGMMDISAGGHTVVDPSLMMSNREPIGTVQVGAIPDKLIDLVMGIEERINQAFYRDVLELPSMRNQAITATEINARLDQFMRQAAPVFSRIENNYNAPHVNLVYDILQLNGLLPPKPELVAEFEEMAGEKGVEFDYESPIKVARDKAEAANIMDGITQLVAGAQMFGEQGVMQLAENFDIDAIAREVGQKLDLPQWCYVPLQVMQEGRAARMQQQEAMAQAEMMNKAAPVLGGAAQLGKMVPEAMEAGLLPAPDQEEGLPLPEIDAEFSEVPELALEGPAMEEEALV